LRGSVTLDVTRNEPVPWPMILNYRDARTARFAAGQRVKQFERFRRQAEKVLDRLAAATSLRDVANFPGHRMEKLKGDRKDQWSLRVNAQWRVCFEWQEDAAGPSNVEIVDYH
jgi:toxin HigB-1